MYAAKQATYIRAYRYYYGTLAVIFPFANLLVYHFIKTNSGDPVQLSFILSHPLALMISGMTSALGAELGLYILVLKKVNLVSQYYTEARYISQLIGSVFILLSIINLSTNGGYINP